MFTWERWSNGEVEVLIREPEEMAEFLDMVRANGYHVQTSNSDYISLISEKGIYVYFNASYNGTYVRYDRRIDSISFNEIGSFYEMPTSTDLMSFLEE